MDWVKDPQTLADSIRKAPAAEHNPPRGSPRKRKAKKVANKGSNAYMRVV
jgi:hypothetical protein